MTGAVCMELARQQPGGQFLSRVVSSLTKARATSPVPLPIVSLLLAQAEGSLGAKAKWERNLRVEWFSWPAGFEHSFLGVQVLLSSPFLCCHFLTSLFYRNEACWVVFPNAFACKTVECKLQPTFWHRIHAKPKELGSSSNTFESIVSEILEDFAEAFWGIATCSSGSMQFLQFFCI